MRTIFKSGTAVLLTTLFISGAAYAADLTAKSGMTLYSFDKDVGGVPTCYDACATNWPPYLAAEGDTMPNGWTLVDRKDGKKQWAYDKKPLYFYKNDAKSGDMMGDGLNGVWHVIKE